MKPSKPSMICAVILGGEAAIAWACGSRTAATVLACLAAGTCALLWHIPLYDDNGNDIEALITATREDIPDHVPAGWTEEYNQ